MKQEIINRFKHHPPQTPEVVLAHERVRSWCLDLAIKLSDNLPESPELAQALSALELVQYHANACVARNLNPKE